MQTFAKRLGQQLKSYHNAFDFFLRNQLAWSRKGYQEPGITLNEIKDYLGPKSPADIDNLVIKYGFNSILPHLSLMSALDNLVHLYLLDAMEIIPGESSALETEKYKILDIGSKNFAYCLALEAFCKHSKYRCSLPPEISGIEIDPHRLYSNFYSRQSYASYFTHLGSSISYHAGDFLTFPFSQTFHLITHFYPFVLKEPLLDWGLTLDKFQPMDGFQRVYDLLLTGGTFLLANTDEIEKDTSFEMIRELFVLDGETFIQNELTNQKPILSPDS